MLRAAVANGSVCCFCCLRFCFLHTFRINPHTLTLALHIMLDCRAGCIPKPCVLKVTSLLSLIIHRQRHQQFHDLGVSLHGLQVHVE